MENDKYFMYNLIIDYKKGVITSLKYKENELLSQPSLLCYVRLRDKNGDTLIVYSNECELMSVTEGNNARYKYKDLIEIEISYAKKENILWKVLLFSKVIDRENECLSRIQGILEHHH